MYMLEATVIFIWAIGKSLQSRAILAGPLIIKNSKARKARKEPAVHSRKWITIWRDKRV